MAELQQHRYDAMMRRVGDLKGPGSKVAEVLSEVFPIVDLEKPPPELYGLGGTQLAFGGTSRTAIPAEAAKVQIFNPVDSGKVMTVTTLIVSVSASDGFRWGVTNAPLDTLPQLQRLRDQRFGFTTLPSGQIQTESSVGFAPGTIVIQCQTNVPFLITDIDGLAVLSPGTGLQMSPRSVNTTINVGFYWRERVMEPSEVTL